MLRDFLSKTYSREVYIGVIICCVVLLCTISLVILYSVTSYGYIAEDASPITGFRSQAAYVFFGALVCYLFYKFHSLVQFTYRFWMVFLGIVVMALIYCGVFGVSAHGATRWIPIGPITIQPAEFLKPAILLAATYIASRFNRGSIGYLKLVAESAVFVFLPIAVLLFFCNDMGSSMICLFCVLFVYYLAGFSGTLIIVLLGIVAAAILATSFFGDSFRSARFVFLNPWDDGQNGMGDGYQLIRSYYAIASGGFFGRGIGASHEKYDYLFGSDNDFVFSIICEELGLLGALVVLLCIVAIFVCSCKLASMQNGVESKLLVYGAAFLLVSQSLINIASAVGCFPTTGKPLPFVSAGGSSVMASFILLGFILSFAKNAEIETEHDRRRGDIQIYTRTSDHATSKQKKQFGSMLSNSSVNAGSRSHPKWRTNDLGDKRNDYVRIDSGYSGTERRADLRGGSFGSSRNRHSSVEWTDSLSRSSERRSTTKNKDYSKEIKQPSFLDKKR